MKCARLAIRTCTLAAIVAALFSIASAQNRERFGISAKAGGVNAVVGHVMVKRDGQAPQLLSNRDDLVAGDVVTTGRDSRVEVLLNPGSYLRLGENSELVLENSSLDNLLVRLNRGSAIIEATGADDTQLLIGVVTDQQRIMIVRRGIYRINALRGSTDLLVQKGRAFPANDPTQLIKSGKKATFTGGASSVAKLEKSDRDLFENWSRERGKALARANDRLSGRTVSGFLLSAGWSPQFSGRWGLWTFNPTLSCYTFLPFRYGWSSPYGEFYGQYLSPYGFYSGGSCCGGPGGTNGGVTNSGPVIVRNPPTSGGPSGGYTGGSGGGAPTIMPPPSQAGPRDPDGGGRRVGKIDSP
jgi:hypothetical protein